MSTEVDVLARQKDPSGASRNSFSLADRSTDLVNTVLAIVKEVGQILDGVPYVQSLSGVILQIIKVRDEIKANKKRCNEVIDKVLRMSNSMYEKLAEVARSHQREKLSRIEGHLREHERTLTSVYIALNKHKSRSRFSQILSRGSAELDEQDRRLDELNTHLIVDIVFHISLEQAASTCLPEPLLYSDAAPVSLGHDLPPKPSFVVERESHLSTALQILLRDEPTRISILGGGGFGKTTLARMILHDAQIIKRYSSRYFISCESIADVDGLLLELGSMLGIKCAPSAMLPAIRLKFQESTTLLCMDNFETPWEPFGTRQKVEGLLESIASIPSLSLIITLRGEQRPSKIAWTTPLLPSLSTLSLDGAQAILRSITGDIAFTETTLRLLQATDGIPLAITLVSNLLRDGESPESLWRRWSNVTTQVLHTGGEDQQSNLNRSISISVDSWRMNADSGVSRTLLAALSLLPDGFSADVNSLVELQKHLDVRYDNAIQWLRGVVTPSATQTEKQSRISDIHAAVQTLRTVALIRIDETGTSPRIHMLSPIRFYCHQFLATEIKMVRGKILEYYICLLSEVTDDITNPEYYSRVVPEIKNIHSVFQKAFATCSKKGLDRLIDAAIYLTEWSWYIGYYSRETLEMALTKASRNPPLHARCLLSIGDLYQREADTENAEKCFWDAALLFRRCRDLTGEANALQYLGNALYTTRQLDDAEVALKASLELYTKIGDKHGQASGRFRLGELYADRRRYSEAEAHLTSALDTYKALADLLGQANSAQNLSRLHIALGNIVRAEEFARQSLTTAKQANYVLGEGNALRLLGHIYRLTDKVSDARRTLEQALELQKRQKNPIGELNAINDLAQVLIQLDELGVAEKLINDTVDIELNIIQVPDVLTTLGWIYLCGGRLEKAEKVLNTALEFFKKFDDKAWQAEVHAHLGHVYFRFNRLDDAERVLKSIPDADASEDIQMYRMWVLGDLYASKGQLEDAEDTLKLAMDAAKWCQSSYQQGNILRSLGLLELHRGRAELAAEKFEEALTFHRKAQWVSEQATDLRKLGKTYGSLEKCTEEEAMLKEAEDLIRSVSKARELL
ncbi:TPR-like protein [Pholiota conissans]|uniref:TPR-like protein n=1 Tax=Pholiota conissans TaxID=109636 RepID=A0A9P5Z0J0_9AGAR|nr:TPR-like protein [Pholiota conissans]